MSEQNGIDPNAVVPIEAFLGAPCNLVIETWESAQPIPNLDPELLARATAILETVGWLTGHPGLDPFRDAISKNNEHALGALVQLDNFLGMACDKLIDRCKCLKNEKQWHALRHETGLATRLTAAAGRTAQSALAWFLLATANRANGDNTGAIDAFNRAIKAASTIADEHLLAVSFDNLGNTLADIGRFDEALDCYDNAIVHEHDPEGLIAIRTNRSSTLVVLGELHSAAQEQQKIVAEQEAAGNSGRKLGLALDSVAVIQSELGEHDAALQMLERARGLFGPENRGDQIINALNRSEALAAIGDKNAAAQAFVEAHNLAFEFARHNIDVEHYRRGFLASLSKRLPSEDDAYKLFAEGLAARDADKFGQALQLFQLAAQRARNLGDQALAIRIAVNEGTLYFNFEQYDQALEIAISARQEASKLGLARPELMAITNIASLAETGMDIREPLGSLGNLATSVTLLEIHKHIVEQAGLDPKIVQMETYDPGTVANELAMLAKAHYADDLAARYYHEAIEKARAGQGWFELANRLAGLGSVLARSGDTDEAAAVTQELADILSKGVLSERGQLVAHQALGFHTLRHDRQASIDHFRQACALAEALGQRIEPGSHRADFARCIQGLHHELARLLRESGETTAAFEALQGEKGRRLIDALAALRSGEGPVCDSPPKADEVMTLLDHLGDAEPTILVDLAIEEKGLTAYIVGEGSIQAVFVAGSTAELAGVERGDVFEREARMAKVCLSERLLSDLAEAVTAKIAKGRRLLLVPDQILYNLPLHVVPVLGKPWCEHFAIGYLPAAGVLRFAPSRRSPVGRSLVAGDSCGDLPLPFAAAECAEVAAALGVKPLVGPQCSRAAIEAKLQAGALDVVHLALHGRGDASRGGRASLLLADGVGSTEWVAFDELATFPWQVELVVFSGCSTAVSGPRQGHELIGVARAAAERGAAAVIACLWPVGDQAAKVFMTAFYKELISRRAVGPVDLRVVLDHARNALRTWLSTTTTGRVQRRDGRSLRPKATGAATPQVGPEVADALEWAPFILLGDPILGN